MIFSEENYYGLLLFFLLCGVFRWILQLVGHKYFEERKPAFTDNKVLAYSACFFVTVEVLRFFGWRKEDFRKFDEIIEEGIKISKVKKE